VRTAERRRCNRKDIFWAFVLVLGLGTFGPWVNCPYAPTTPPIHCTTSRFLSNVFPRMAPQSWFFSYTIHQVIWPSSGTLDLEGTGTRPDYLVNPWWKKIEDPRATGGLVSNLPHPRENSAIRDELQLLWMEIGKPEAAARHWPPQVPWRGMTPAP